MKSMKKLLTLMLIMGLVLTACNTKDSNSATPDPDASDPSVETVTEGKVVINDVDQALQVALDDQGLTEEDVTVVKKEYDMEDDEYDIEFIYQDKEYEYEIKSDGSIKKLDVDSSDTEIAMIDGDHISMDEAKAIALLDAGLVESDITDLEMDKDSEADKVYYEIEFEVDQKDYEYKIDAVSGEILDKKID